MLKKLIIYVIIFYRIGDKIMNSQNISNNTNNSNFSSSRNISGNSAVTKEKTRYKYTAFDKNG